MVVGAACAAAALGEGERRIEDRPPSQPVTPEAEDPVDEKLPERERVAVDAALSRRSRCTCAFIDRCILRRASTL
jgi:hypothetical protein